MMVMGWILLLFGCIRLIVSLVNWISQPYLSDKVQLTDRPLISVLIPARNEEKNLDNLMGDLILSDYEPMEIIVYDDDSTDQTSSIVENFVNKFSFVHLIHGNGPEAGWLGKNYACNHLAAAARGEFLLFLDADVRVERNFIRRAVCYMQTTRVSLFSVFPRQIISGIGPLLVIPIMNWILLSLLPLPLVKFSSRPSLSAANGQCMVFNASVYRRLLPHQLFKSSPIEDITICKYFKKLHYPVATLLGKRDINCTMYHTLGEAINGFTKNIFGFFGNRKILAFLFALATTLTPFYLFIFNGWMAGVIYLIIIISIQIIISVISIQPVSWNILFAFPRQILFWIILRNAYLKQHQKALIWKNRNISSGSF